MKNVLVLLPLNEQQKTRLEALSPDCAYRYVSADKVTAEEVQAANIILGNPAPDSIGASENLEFLQLAASGADGYVKSGVLREGTVLCSSTGAYGQAVAEHAFAMTWCLVKKLHLYRSSQMRSRWEDHGGVTSLAESTVLVVGLGDIGLSYARLVKAMGARVIGVKRRSGACPPEADELVLTEEIDRVLPEADVIMSVLPSTKDTVHFFTAERFGAMKNTAVFINCGRGDAVAHDVLLQALRTGEIAAAGVDVCETEPLPADSPLWQEEKLLITPHVAGNYHHPSIYRGVVAIGLENIANYLSGKPLRNIVDPLTGYMR